MAKLYFKVASDWEEVVRLRNEITKLKQELKNMDSTQSPAAFKTLNTQLAASTQRMDELVTEAVKAGTVVEGGFKKKIFDASQTVNGFTEKIISQKAVVKDVEADVRRLGDAYRTALKRNPLSASGKLEEYKSAKRALDEEKAALFGLTQQQANARLAVKKLRDEYSLYNNDGKQVIETNKGIGLSLGKALGVIGGVTALKQLGSEIIRVRGEFQSMQTAIETMVGKDVAGKIMPQIKELAKISPLTMTDMVGAEKMMLGFNIQAEDTIKYLKALSDISMGESSKFNSLTLAFSQMSAAGKLMGQDLNQMINAGFNPLQVIAEKTGKSIATLKEEMSKGAISAEMVQQAFIDATSAGGKFYGMSENASKTINGQISMMQDAWDNALNEIGKSSEGFIMSGIQATTSLIQNYETVGKVLVGLIATYGTYRTAVMLVTAAESKHTLVEIGLTNARVLARKAQLALNASMLTNPYVLLAVAVGGLITANLTLVDTTRQLKAAEDDYNKTRDEAIAKEQKLRAETDRYLSVAENNKAAIEDRKDALVQLIQKYPAIFEKYKTEAEMLQHILDIHKEIDKYEKNKSVANPTNELNDVNKQIADLEKLAKQRYHGGRGLTNAENAKLEMLKNKRSELEGTLKKKDADAILSDLTGYSNSQIEAAIKDRERLLAKMQLKGATKGTITGKSILSGTFTKEELEGQKKLLQAALVKPATYKQDYEKAKKDWEDAKKKLSEIDKNKSKFTAKQYEEAKKREEVAEKAYKKLGGSTDKELKKQESEAEKQRKAQEKYKLLVNKQELERIRINEDLQMQVDEARINSMDEGSKKTIAQMELNFEKEMQAIDRQKEDILRKKIGNARSVWEANPENKGKSFDDTGIELSDDERMKFDELYKAAITENEKAYSAFTNQYLSYTDQRLEIEKKFNNDVAVLQEVRKKAVEKGDKTEVEKIDRNIGKRTEIRDEEVFKLDAEQFKKNMNWEQVFGNLDKVSTDTLKRLKSNLKDFIVAQKDLSPENLKELVDAIERIDEKVYERNPFEAMANSFKSLKEATDAEKEAQEAYNKALKIGTSEEQKNTKATLENAKNAKRKALTEATDALHNGVSEARQYIEAGHELIGIMDALGVKAPEWLNGFMSGAGEVLDGLGSIDLTKPVSIVTGSLKAVKGALESVISLGGLFNLGGESDKSLEEDLERLSQSNRDLELAINNLADIMNEASVADATDVYNQQKEYLLKQQSNTQEMMKRSGAAYSNGFLGVGGSHSSNKKINDAMSGTDWKRISEIVGRSINSSSDFWTLTSEEMAKVANSASDLYTKIKQYADDGYKNAAQYMDEYIQYYKELEELENAYRIKLTSISFDSLRDNFKSTLLDMESDTEDFANNFEKMMQEAVVESLMTSKYDRLLQEWYKEFAKAMNGGELTEKEQSTLKKKWEDIINQGIAERDALKDLMGWDTSSSSSQSSTKGYSTTASQDSIDEANGRMTALQIAGEEIKNQNILQTQSLNILTMKADTILSVNTDTRNIADEIRSIQINSYLELQEIRENTGAIVKPIQQMQKDIAEVKKNTSKL